MFSLTPDEAKQRQNIVLTLQNRLWCLVNVAQSSLPEYFSN